MNNGWVKIHRKSIDSTIWKNPNIWFVWSWCLMKANHQDNEFPFNGSDIIVKKGQFITGINKAVSELPKITHQQYRTAIKYLKSTSRITIKATNQFSLITVNKWEEYQADNKQTNKQTNKRITNEQQTDNKRITTNKNDKNDKNEKNISKDIQVKPATYGDEDINFSIKCLTDKLGASLDGSIKENRQYAKLLINRLKKDYPDYETKEQIKVLVDVATSDSFHAKNSTNFKYLFYNIQKIIQTVKNNKSNMKII